MPGSSVQCLVLDEEQETLTPADAADGEQCGYSAASGLAAYVARTGERVQLERINLDPRYDPDIDNPEGWVDARLLAAPIPGLERSSVGVLAVLRSGSAPAFTPAEARLIAFLAECAAPTLAQILLQSRVQSWLVAQAAGTESNSEIFRQEAIAYHLRNWDQEGEVLKTPPTWLRRTYWAMLGLFLAGTVLAAVWGLRVK
jgi:GAF domain-containing protein